MSVPGAILHGFAYGEHLEGAQQRSLGFRLLAPAEPASWCAEIEALARGLQGAPYPDHWPPTELFCSVLLDDGQRLVALARYGLADHTPSRRRGGLELLGVVGPGNLGVASALAIYQWLTERRASSEDLHALGGQFPLAEVLSAVPPQPPPSEAVPVLPIRIWQEGALLFAATAPSDPDRRLGLLEQGSASAWQWLPLVGADFPLASYTQRGPLVAWTPHLVGVAVKLERQPADAARPIKPRSLAGMLVGLLLICLLGANLWATLALGRKVGSSPLPTPARTSEGSAASNDTSREELALAIHHVLSKRGGTQDWSQAQLVSQYEILAAEDEGLHVNSREGKAALGAVSLLARRSPGQVEGLVREALATKGYDPALVDRACQLVREKLAADGRAGR